MTGIIASDDDTSVDARVAYAAGRDMDIAFMAAMHRAIRAKRERAYVGIKIDLTPFTGRMIHPEPVFSGCSSSGAMCADNGSQDVIGRSDFF